MFLINIMCDNNKCVIKRLQKMLEHYKHQEMCNKAVNNYPHALGFVAECCKTQKMCDKADHTHSPTLNMFLNALSLKKCVIKQFIDDFCI